MRLTTTSPHLETMVETRPRVAAITPAAVVAVPAELVATARVIQTDPLAVLVELAKPQRLRALLSHMQVAEPEDISKTVRAE
jgi:hypothetical protein